MSDMEYVNGNTPNLFPGNTNPAPVIPEQEYIGTTGAWEYERQKQVSDVLANLDRDTIDKIEMSKYIGKVLGRQPGEIYDNFDQVYTQLVGDGPGKTDPRAGNFAARFYDTFNTMFQRQMLANLLRNKNANGTAADMGGVAALMKKIGLEYDSEGNNWSKNRDQAIEDLQKQLAGKYAGPVEGWGWYGNALGMVTGSAGTMATSMVKEQTADGSIFIPGSSAIKWLGKSKSLAKIYDLTAGLPKVINSTEALWQVSANEVYLTEIENGVSHDIAEANSRVAGVIIGSLDKIGLAKWEQAIFGKYLQQATGALMKGRAASVAAGKAIAGQFGVATGTEVLTEATQEYIQALFENMSYQMENDVNKNPVALKYKQDWNDMAGRLKEVTLQTLAGVGTLGILGGGIRYAGTSKYLQGVSTREEMNRVANEIGQGIKAVQEVNTANPMAPVAPEETNAKTPEGEVKTYYVPIDQSLRSGELNVDKYILGLRAHADETGALEETRGHSTAPVNPRAFLEAVAQVHPSWLVDAMESVLARKTPNVDDQTVAQWEKDNPGFTFDDMVEMAEATRDRTQLLDRNRMMINYGLEKAIPTGGTLTVQVKAQNIVQANTEEEVRKAYQEGAEAVEYQGDLYVRDASRISVTQRNEITPQAIKAVGDYTIQANENTYRAVAKDGTEIGRAELDRDGDRVTLRNVYVAPEYRRQGVADRLVSQVAQNNPASRVQFPRANTAEARGFRDSVRSRSLGAGAYLANMRATERRLERNAQDMEALSRARETMDEEEVAKYREALEAERKGLEAKEAYLSERLDTLKEYGEQDPAQLTPEQYRESIEGTGLTREAMLRVLEKQLTTDEAETVLEIVDRFAKYLGRRTDDFLQAALEGFRLVDGIQTPEGGWANGVTNFKESGKAIVDLSRKSNPTTVLHEMFHVLRRHLKAEDGIKLLDATGEKVWNENAEEKAARMFEAYLKDGKAPDLSLKAIFDKLATWFKWIYEALANRLPQVHPQAREVFDKILTAAENAPVEMNADGTVMDFYQRAYHGTPHQFDQFTTEAMGTGEGVQAYGWGLYFAGNKEVAEWYREKLTTTEEYVNGEHLNSDNPVHFLAKALNQSGGNIEDAKDFLETMAKPGGNRTVQGSAIEALKLLEKGERPTIETRKPSGQLYEVEIPDQDEYLDWDKPLNQQSEKVKKTLAKAWSEPNGLPIEDGMQAVEAESITGGMWYLNEAAQKEGAKIGDPIFRARNGGDKEVSKYLKSIGIPGINFLDGSSRNKGEGNYNYVIFADEDVAIVNKLYQEDLSPGDGKPAETLYQYIGESAELTVGEKRSMATAKRLDASGLDMEEIRLKTGWFRGPYDGKWRMETADSPGFHIFLDKLQEDGAEIQDVLLYPEFFKRYPQAKNITIAKLPRMETHGLSVVGAMGISDAGDHYLFLSLDGKPTQWEVSKTVVHELQHWIQGVEGYAKGASVDEIDERRQTVERMFTDYSTAAQIALAVSKGQSYDEAIAEYEDTMDETVDYTHVTLARESTYEKLQEKAEALWNEKTKLRYPAAVYNRTSGEIEARDVQSRYGLSKIQRRARRPFSSENIGPEEAVTLFQDELTEERAEKVLSMEPINAPPTPEPVTLEWVKVQLRGERRVVNDDSGNTVQITVQAGKKVFSHSANKNVLRIIPIIDEVMKKAVYLFSEGNLKEKKENLSIVRHYAALIGTGKEVQLATITTHVWKGNETLDQLKNWSLENKRAEADRLNESGATTQTEAEPHKNRIVQAIRNVKSDFLFQDDTPADPRILFQKVTEEEEAQFSKALKNGEKNKAYRILHKAIGIEKVDGSINRGGAHSPPPPSAGAPLWDVSDDIYPEDVYSWKGLQYYGTGEDRMDRAAWTQIKDYQGKPNLEVTVYRAVEKDYKGKIIPGDWVTTIRAYAKEHVDHALNGEGKILSKKVAARDIYTNGDSWLEWGYHPQDNVPTIRAKVNEDGTKEYKTLQEYVDQYQKALNEDGVRLATLYQKDPDYREQYRTLKESERAVREFEKNLDETISNASQGKTTSEKKAIREQFEKALDSMRQALEEGRKALAETVAQAKAQAEAQGETFNPHKESTRKAVEAGKIVPTASLEKYRAEEWAERELARRTVYKDLMEESLGFDSIDAWIEDIKGYEEFSGEAKDPRIQEESQGDKDKATDIYRAIYKAARIQGPEDANKAFLARVENDPKALELILYGLGQNPSGTTPKGVAVSVMAQAKKVAKQGKMNEAQRSRVLSAIRNNPTVYRQLYWEYGENQRDEVLVENLALEKEIQEAVEAAELPDVEIKPIEIPTDLEMILQAKLALGTETQVFWRDLARTREKEIADLEESLNTLEKEAAQAHREDLQAGREARNSAAQEMRLTIKRKLAEMKAARNARDRMKAMAKFISSPVPASVHVDYRVQIERIQAMVDPTNRRDDPDSFRNIQTAWYADHPEALGKLSARKQGQIMGKSLNLWTMEELESMYEQVKILRDLGREALNQKKEEWNGQVRDWKNKVLRAFYSELEALGAERDKAREAGDLEKQEELRQKIVLWEKALRPGNVNEETSDQWKKGFVDAAILTLPNLADKMDGGQDYKGPNYELLYTMVKKAETEKIMAQQKRLDAMFTWMKSEGISTESLGRKIKFGAISYRVDELLTMYVGMKNERKAKALLHGNRIDQEVIKYALEAEEMGWLRKLGDKILEDYQANYDRLSQAFHDYQNDVLGAEAFYSPMVRQDVVYEPMDAQLDWEKGQAMAVRKASVEKGFTQSRVDLADEHQTPIKLGEFGLWVQQVARQEQYIAMSPPTKMLNAVYGDKFIAASIKQIFGSGYAKEIKGYINLIANPYGDRTWNWIESMGARLRGNAAVAYMSWNPLTVLKQTPALAQYLPYVDAKHLLGSIAELATGKLMAKVDNLSPQMKARVGYQELEDLEAGKLEGVQSGVYKFSRLGMKGIPTMDKIIVVIGWNAVYQKALSEGATQEAAVTLADEVTNRTQATTSVADSSGIFRNPSEFTRLFTMFAGPTNKILNEVIYGIPQALKNKHLDKAAWLGMSYAIGALAIYALAKGEVPDEPEDFALALGQQTADMIPVLGPAVSLTWRKLTDQAAFTDTTPNLVLSGYKAGEVIYNAVEGVQDAQAGDTAKALKHLENTAIKALETGGLVAGFPTTQPKRIYQAIRDGNGWKLIGWGKEKD